MEEPNSFVDIDFDQAFPVSVEEDDASSVGTTDEMDVHADQACKEFPDKEFPTFDDLRASVSAFSNVGFSQMGDNSRCLPSPSLPTSWLRRMFLDVRGSIKYSGFLYCKCKQSPSFVCAVAQQNNIVICVAHCGIDKFQVFTPRGDFMDCSDENAVASPFFLWCTGGHYQAIVKVSDFEILASAFESQPFKTSRLLDKNHFRFE